MNARQILEECSRRLITVTRDGENLALEALFPEDFPIPQELVDEVKENKAEVLLAVEYAERADALVLESTRRIGAAWPSGFPLEGPEWDAHEQHLHEAYWSGDLEQLKSALEAREQYALRVFGAHRNGVRNV